MFGLQRDDVISCGGKLCNARKNLFIILLGRINQEGLERRNMKLIKHAFSDKETQRGVNIAWSL
jgi:hypothetical protein